MKQSDARSPLTMLRGFLALAIIWGHLQTVPLKLLGIDCSSLTFIPGRVIVWLFFMISGFSIYSGYRNNKYSMSRKDMLRFYFNRAIRILPLFYVTVFLTWMCKLYLAPESLPQWPSILRTMFFLDFNFYDGIFSFTPTWFIGVLVYFYALSPFLIKGYLFFSRRVPASIMLLALIGISVIFSFLGYLSAGSPDIRNIIGCLPFFLFGFFSFDLLRDRPDFLQKIFQYIPRKFFYLILFTLFELIFLFYYNQAVVHPFLGMKIIVMTAGLLMEAYIGCLGIILIVVLLSKKETLSKNILSPAAAALRSLFSALGQQAFGIYLWHSLVILFFSALGLLKGPPFHSLSEMLAAFFIVVIVTYLISSLAFYLVEKPYRDLYRKDLNREA